VSQHDRKIVSQLDGGLPIGMQWLNAVNTVPLLGVEFVDRG
jgi:hypothetical protein